MRFSSQQQLQTSHLPHKQTPEQYLHGSQMTTVTQSQKSKPNCFACKSIGPSLKQDHSSRAYEMRSRICEPRLRNETGRQLQTHLQLQPPPLLPSPHQLTQPPRRSTRPPLLPRPHRRWRGPGDLSKGGKVCDSSGMDDVCTGGNEYLDMVCGYRVRGG